MTMVTSSCICRRLQESCGFRMRCVWTRTRQCWNRLQFSCSRPVCKQKCYRSEIQVKSRSMDLLNDWVCLTLHWAIFFCLIHHGCLDPVHEKWFIFSLDSLVKSMEIFEKTGNPQFSGSLAWIWPMLHSFRLRVYCCCCVTNCNIRTSCFGGLHENCWVWNLWGVHIYLLYAHVGLNCSDNRIFIIRTFEPEFRLRLGKKSNSVVKWTGKYCSSYAREMESRMIGMERRFMQAMLLIRAGKCKYTCLCKLQQWRNFRVIINSINSINK